MKLKFKKTAFLLGMAFGVLVLALFFIVPKVSATPSTCSEKYSTAKTHCNNNREAKCEKCQDKWKCHHTDHWPYTACNWEKECSTSCDNCNDTNKYWKYSQGSGWMNGQCPVPTSTPTPTNTPTSTPTPTPTEEPIPTPTIEPTPTAVPELSCEEQVKAGTWKGEHECGWSPKPWEPGQYSPATCGGIFTDKPLLQHFVRVSPTEIELGWWRPVSGVDKYSLIYGYKETEMIHGVINIPGNSTGLTIGALRPNTYTFFQLWAWRGECVTKSTVIDP
jgi:hypothetical protein